MESRLARERTVREIRIVFQADSVYDDPFEIGFILKTFHAIVADFLRIQIAAVTFSAADAFPVIQYAWMFHR